MGLGTSERVDSGAPLGEGLGKAFAALRRSCAIDGSLVFDSRWQPTMDLVDLVAGELLRDPGDLANLTLVHPSAAMGFIASALGLRVTDVQFHVQRSVHDDPPELDTGNFTASRTLFVMEENDVLETFVRASVRAARERVVSRFALMFHAKANPSMDLVDVLVEELMESGVREIGLIHPLESLDTVVAALKLRLPALRVQSASRPGA